MFRFDYDAGRGVFECLTCKTRVSNLFRPRVPNHHKGACELPPISWTSGNGRFSMSIDLRVKHDLESRRRAVELFDAGVGCKPAAEALSVPRETVREWQWVYRAFGSEALLSMDGKQQLHIRAEGRRGVGRGRRRDGEPTPWPSSGSGRSPRWSAGAGSTARAAPRRCGPDRRAGRGGRGRNPGPAPASRSSRSAAAGSRPRSPT